MNIHEYQAKAVLKEFGVPVPRGVPILAAGRGQEPPRRNSPARSMSSKRKFTPAGAAKARFKEPEAGPQGGVRLAKSPAEVEKFVGEMLGRTLVTVQTGPAGKQVNRLYLEEGSNIARELYLSLLVDRETSRVAFVASTEGGMNIEDVAHATPEKIVSFSVDPATGVQPHHGRRLAKALGLEGDLAKQAGRLATQLYEAFVAKDMAMLEINPLVVSAEEPLICLDAKISFDSNALYRHPEIARAAR